MDADPLQPLLLGGSHLSEAGLNTRLIRGPGEKALPAEPISAEMCLVPVHNVSFARDILGISAHQAFKGSKTEKQKIIRTVKVLHGLLLTPVLHEDSANLKGGTL